MDFERQLGRPELEDDRLRQALKERKNRRKQGPRYVSDGVSNNSQQRDARDESGLVPDPLLIDPILYDHSFDFSDLQLDTSAHSPIAEGDVLNLSPHYSPPKQPTVRIVQPVHRSPRRSQADAAAASASKRDEEEDYEQPATQSDAELSDTELVLKQLRDKFADTAISDGFLDQKV